MKLGTLPRAALVLAASLLSVMAAAQTARTGLDIPANPQFVAPADHNVRKATAIVNGEVITESDIDHRLALVAAAGNFRIPPEELLRIRQQVLRNLIDETLQIQAASEREITVEQREVDTQFARLAQTNGRTAAALAAHLRTIGSSERSLKRQIRGELAWQRLLRREIQPYVNVGDEEVQGIIDRLNASRGTPEYHVREIFISATPETAAQAMANAARIVEQIRAGAAFGAFARQFSEASTAAREGDLGWVRAEQLPAELALALPNLAVGTISDPIPVQGGFSVIALQDRRQVLTTDERDAVLSLKQITIAFPAGATPAVLEPRIQDLVRTTQNMGGCGGSDAAAASLNAEVVSEDQIRLGDLPPALQEMLRNLNIGQATRPFGSPERVSVLVLCGRDDPQTATAPSFETVYNSLTEERVNRRAQRFLRDLRRDAVIDYR